jgi:hypothetical protein
VIRAARRAVAAAAAAVCVGCAVVPSALPLRAAPPLAGTGSPYVQAIRFAVQSGLHVWLEADLVRRWLEGPQAFDEGLTALGRLAAIPGVVGIKYADELGYGDGLDGNPSGIRSFLVAAGRGLARTAPGKRLLIDMVVPALGCAPGLRGAGAGPATCSRQADRAHPALTVENVETYMRSGGFDTLDLSTGLLNPTTYTSWGIDEATAQRLAWQLVGRLGWGRHVDLQARKALAHAGAFQGGAAAAESGLRLYVDIPVSESAGAVDLWTWRQTYQGSLVRLMDPGLRPNALWGAILARHRSGVDLFTHFSPTSVERSTSADLAVLAEGFDSVFMAAGIG